MSISFNARFTIGELIEDWKENFPEIKWSPNGIFNFADSNKLTLYAEKISWPFRIWCFKVNTPLIYRSENHLLCVETGELSLHDAQISTCKREIITDEDAIRSLECDDFFDIAPASNEETRETSINYKNSSSYDIYKLMTKREKKTISKEAIQKRKKELIDEEKKVRQSNEAHEYLEFHIADFEEFLYKRRGRIDREINRPELDNVKMLSAPYASIKMKDLNGNDLDAKDYLAERFDDPDHDYLYKELSIARNNGFNNEDTDQQKLFNPVIAFPSHQIQLDYYAKVDKSDLYVLRADKEKAEEFLKELREGEHQSEKKQTLIVESDTHSSSLTDQYKINDLITDWNNKDNQKRFTSNVVFNLAYNDKLTLYAKKISWPYKIWAYQGEWINDEVEFSMDDEISLLETGMFSIHDVKLSIFGGIYISIEEAIENILHDDVVNKKINRPFESLTQAEIEQRRVELNPNSKERYNSIEDNFLSFDVTDFKFHGKGCRFKDWSIESEDLKPPYKTIPVEHLSDHNFDAKEIISEQFNELIMEQISQPEWTKKQKKIGLIYQIEEPGLQVEMEYSAKIDQSDIYILRSDKEQAEKYLDPLFIKKEEKNKNHDDIKIEDDKKSNIKKVSPEKLTVIVNAYKQLVTIKINGIKKEPKTFNEIFGSSPKRHLMFSSLAKNKGVILKSEYSNLIENSTESQRNSLLREVNKNLKKMFDLDVNPIITINGGIKSQFHEIRLSNVRSEDFNERKHEGKKESYSTDESASIDAETNKWLSENDPSFK